MTANPVPVQINSEEINQEYEAIEEILKRERYSNQQVKEHILTIGYKLEKMFKDSGNETFISEISELILRTLRKRGLGHLRHNADFWLREFPQWRQEHSSGTTMEHSGDLPEHFSIKLEQLHHAYKVLEKEFDINTISQIPPELEPKLKRQIENIRDSHDGITDRFTKLYEEKDWSSLEDDYDPLTAAERLARSERNHIKKPPPLEEAENPAYQAAVGYDETWHKVMNKLRDYYVLGEDGKPNRERNLFIAKGIDAMDKFLRPDIDDKHREDQFGWIKIVRGLKTTSIHHMSNLTRTADIYGKLRHITKEQISDNKDKILKFNYEFMKNWPGFDELSVWFHEASLPYRKELTNATSPKLSASA